MHPILLEKPCHFIEMQFKILYSDIEWKTFLEHQTPFQNYIHYDYLFVWFSLCFCVLFFVLGGFFLFRCKLLVPLDFFYCISNTLLHDILYRFWFFITCKIHKKIVFTYIYVIYFYWSYFSIFSDVCKNLVQLY